MKNYISVLFLFISLTAFSQSDNLKKFRVEAGILASIPSTDNLNNGFGFYLNPKYALDNNFLLGVKLEVTGIKSKNNTYPDVSNLFSYTLTSDYYFSKNNSRYFIGLDAGIYNLISDEYALIGSDSVSETAGGYKFGLAPKLGITYKKLDIAIHYNFILGSDELLDPSKYQYAAISLGFHFGGGTR